MRNPARLAAALSGRPLLMREAAVPALARLIGMDDGERGSPIANFFGRARRARASRGEVEALTEPTASAPHWVGEPDAIGFGWVLKDGVAVLEVNGPLMAEGFGWGDSWYHGYDTLRHAYEEMAADARVGAIWEVVRSPGGVVDAGLPELAALKREIRALNGGKPIHSFLRDGYSAAYWLPSGSDHIRAARESGVGSIGAVVTHCGMAGAFEKEGIVITPFKFGKRKTDGSPLEPLSDTASQSLQAEIDQCGRWFVADVLAGRANLTEEAVLATEAGCFFGDSDDPALSGLAHGLVDEISSERKAFADVRELAQQRLASSTTTAPTPAATQPAPKMETEMKRTQVLAAARKAGLSAEHVRKLGAELPEDDKPKDAVDEEDEGDDKNDQPEGDPPKDDKDDKGKDDPEVEADEDEENEAKRICASKEAAAHPQLALAAISTNQTFAQFQANVKSAGSSQGRGRLDAAMSGARRLKPDATKSASGMSASIAARIEKNRGAKASA